MNPWRAALTSATASGKSTRIASRSAIACSSTPPCGWICASAAEVSSTAVLSVSVANCSRCASCTRLGLLLGELAQAAHQLLGVAAERESEASPSMRKLASGRQASGPCSRRSTSAASSSTAGAPAASRPQRRAGVVAERLLEPPRRDPERVEVLGRREPRLRLQGLGERCRRFLGLLDALRRLGLAQLARAARAARRDRRRPPSPPPPRTARRATPPRARAAATVDGRARGRRARASLRPVPDSYAQR